MQIKGDFFGEKYRIISDDNEQSPNIITGKGRRTGIPSPTNRLNRNSTEGKQQKIKSAHGCARRDAKNKIEAELKLLVGDVILLGIQSRINRRNRHSAWATPALRPKRAGRLAYAKARVIRSVAAQLRYALRYALPTN